MISPLLANIYLHWFDKRFHESDGPSQFAQARLVRYADDFVVMVRRRSQPMIDRVEWLLEDWMGLTINRDKTRLVNLRDGRSGLDFLGYTFRYERDLFGRPHRYLHWMPSAKALQRERDRLREMTGSRFGFVPVRVLIKRLNRHLAGWDNYFRLGHPYSDGFPAV